MRFQGIQIPQGAIIKSATLSICSYTFGLTGRITAKLQAEAADDPGVPEAERVRGRALAEGLSMAALTMAWQLLLKGLGEVRRASSPLQAAEMVVVRLVFASDLPSPAEAVAALAGSTGAPPAAGRGRAPSPGGTPAAGPAMGGDPVPSPPPSDRPRAQAVGDETVSGPRAHPHAAPGTETAKPDPVGFAEVVALTLVETSPWPVMKTMDIRRPAPASASCKSSPVRPGIRTSSTRQHGPAYGSRARNSRADANASTAYPAALTSRARLFRTEGSSSTMKTSDAAALIARSPCPLAG